MAHEYSDPRYGVLKPVCVTPLSGALNGTVGATVLTKVKLPEAVLLSKLQVYFSVGGTAAGTRQLLVGLELAGTGTVAYFGTAALGTAANATTATFTVAGTANANDNLVIAHQGTAADVYNVGVQVWGNEQFTNLV